ncbi:hypothetical protein PybrP1_004090 [[Pythium] brassicae (nom. inval.)]|nr:hypothetical protein PybrP1_004090 [[Pythium] brassicae (nom. inval.)]
MAVASSSAAGASGGASNGGPSTAAPSAQRPPAFRAASVRSGDVVVLGMRVDAAINCAGMALFRVFQGHVEVLGFQPALGTYYSLFSPRWSNLLVLSGRTNADTRSHAAKQLLGAAYQAPFCDASRRLLALAEPAAVVDMDDEHDADALARDIAEEFPIVLVFRAVPVTFGNVVSYYERSRAPDAGAVVLPGFKIVLAKEDWQELRVGDADADAALGPPAGLSPVELQYHDWKSSARVLAELAHADAYRTIQITPQWRATVDAIEASLRAGGWAAQSVVVCGAKGVGKSTFCRYLVNRLLAHYGAVAFLDTDLGQSELTPPGLVSLHALAAPLLGPGFAHMKPPLRSFFCGGANPGTDPLYYMRAVRSLLRLYAATWGAGAGRQPPMPLVINTDGWIKSMGHDLLCSVIQDAAPDHVVQLLATTKNKQFTVPTDPKWTIHGVPPWDPTGLLPLPRASKDMRLYRWHAYFLGRRSAAHLAAQQRLQDLHLVAERHRADGAISRAYTLVAPFAVPFDCVDVSFAGSSVPPSQLLHSLNNSVVGLCVNPRRPQPQPQLVGRPAGPPRVLLEPPHAPCLGIGLVRAVDAERRLLFIVSPLALAVVRRVNLLVRGNLALESIAVDVESPVQAPYVVTDGLAAEGTGAAVMQSRNNIKRKRDN